MNDADATTLRSIGLDPIAKLSRTDIKLWLAFARLKAGDPARLRNDLNRKLMTENRLEYGEAALAREAPASRNTIADNRERLAPILSGLGAIEAARKLALRETRNGEAERECEERRTSIQKDRIIEQQASVIAAQQVQIHALERRIAAAGRRAVNPEDASPALGHRRRPSHASAQRGRGASQASR